MYVCMYVCMDGWMDGWMDGCMYVCMYVCMYACMYVYVRICLSGYVNVCMACWYVCKYVPNCTIHAIGKKRVHMNQLLCIQAYCNCQVPLKGVFNP